MYHKLRARNCRFRLKQGTGPLFREHWSTRKDASETFFSTQAEQRHLNQKEYEVLSIQETTTIFDKSHLKV